MQKIIIAVLVGVLVGIGGTMAVNKPDKEMQDQITNLIEAQVMTEVVLMKAGLAEPADFTSMTVD